ncbi:MAG: AsmA family protein, partial [Verrucomicrobiales bacterium]|nr:AsmA family protein [Verrucomicrobiales bacterium]
LRLTPTDRAKNQIQVAGDLDFSKTNALKGAFKLTAESVDVTPYFDLFAGAPKPAGATTPPPATPAPATGPQREPDAIRLPVENLTFDARIGKFFLREIAAENWVASLRVTHSTVELEPLELSLNGAPIKAGAKLDLSVPGYIYNLKATADHVPVRPFANSFAPSLKDRIEGAMNTSLDVKGAGVTGTSLQKSLAGAVSFNVTNANLKLLDGAQQKGVLSVLTRVLATTLNIRELHDRPIMDIVAKAKMGDGKIELTDASARSESMLAGTSGVIPIATDLMQSPLNFPVNISLRRDLALRARLVGTNTPTNQVYVPLPALASLKGTLGAPVPEVDKTRAALMAAKGLAGILGGQAGSTVGGVADLIGGVSKGGTNAAGQLIQGLGNLLGGGAKTGASTNANSNAAAPAGASNAPAAKPNPLGDLLKGVLEPKKPQ